MDNSIFSITFIGMLSGVVGTGTGAVLAYALGGRSVRFLSFILEFAAGLMTAVVCFDLLPGAFEMASVFICLIGFIIGVIMAIFIQDKIKYSPRSRKKRTGLLATGFVIMAGIALHNFPEGLAIGAGLEVSVKFGMAIAIVIAFHDIPEGLAMALPLRMEGYKPLKAIVMSAATGLPMCIGAFVGAAAGSVSEQWVAMCLACAGGAMLYIVCGDLIPESKKLYKGRMAAVGNVTGFIVGMVVSICI